jgi:hypothetical protein
MLPCGYSCYCKDNPFNFNKSSTTGLLALGFNPLAMTRTFTLIFLLQLSFASFAQRDTSATEQLKSFTKIDLTLPGTFLTRESKLGKNSVAEFSVGAGYAVGYSDYFGWVFDAQFAASVLTKFYYNREKRKLKGKSLRLNAGNYIGAEAVYTQTFSNTPVERDLGVYVLWGMQRPMGKRWIFNLRGGGGYVRDMVGSSNAQGLFSPMLWVSFSYVLSGRAL